ncbi:MAG TPA: PadR family transcriptional regulator [Bacillota bacterium]|nr:PadR family transcriptional regulator [Bacillota bacterium]
MGEKNIQLKKGVIEILILKLLSREKMYGYQLLQELDSKSNGVFKMKEGTLYPVLYRLEDGGLISSLWEDPDGSWAGARSEKRPVPRKYYQITAAGVAELDRRISDFHNLVQGIYLILEEEPRNV